MVVWEGAGIQRVLKRACVEQGFPARLETRTKESNVLASPSVLSGSGAVKAKSTTVPYEYG